MVWSWKKNFLKYQEKVEKSIHRCKNKSVFVLLPENTTEVASPRVPNESSKITSRKNTNRKEKRKQKM